jgi:hypothetical protein
MIASWLLCGVRPHAAAATRLCASLAASSPTGPRELISFGARVCSTEISSVQRVSAPSCEASSTTRSFDFAVIFKVDSDDTLRTQSSRSLVTIARLVCGPYGDAPVYRRLGLGMSFASHQNQHPRYPMLLNMRSAYSPIKRRRFPVGRAVRRR